MLEFITALFKTFFSTPSLVALFFTIVSFFLFYFYDFKHNSNNKYFFDYLKNKLESYGLYSPTHND